MCFFSHIVCNSKCVTSFVGNKKRMNERINEWKIEGLQQIHSIFTCTASCVTCATCCPENSQQVAAAECGLYWPTCDESVHVKASRRWIVSQFHDDLLRTSNLRHENELCTVGERHQINSNVIQHRALSISAQRSWRFVATRTHNYRTCKFHISISDRPGNFIQAE